MRNICFITTTRAEYGLLKPLIFITQNTSEFCITLIVSGTHLLSSFGNTFEEIKKDFTDFYKIPIMEENTLDMCKIISKVFDTFPEEIKKINDIKKIDLAVILGDRFEILAISQVLFILGIKICHLAGGDETKGALDDEFRNSISQICNYHMPFSEESKNRLLRMNINSNKIFLIGNPGLEIFNNYNCTTTKKEIIEKYKLNNDYIFVVFHPETKRKDDYIKTFFNNLLNIIKKYKLDIILIKPNCDPQYTIILEEICNLNQKNSNNFIIIDSLNRNEYLDIALNSSFYIGNSSSGVYELPYLKIPIINVGNRQDGRGLASNILNSDFDNIEKNVDKIIMNKNNILKDIKYFYPIYNSKELFLNFLKKL